MGSALAAALLSAGRCQKLEDLAAAQNAAGYFFGVAGFKNGTIHNVGSVNGGPVAEHTGVDQLIQYADGQLADVLGAQVVQNQQVGLLAGIQPGSSAARSKCSRPS